MLRWIYLHTKTHPYTYIIPPGGVFDAFASMDQRECDHRCPQNVGNLWILYGSWRGLKYDAGLAAWHSPVPQGHQNLSAGWFYDARFPRHAMSDIVRWYVVPLVSNLCFN